MEVKKIYARLKASAKRRGIDFRLTLTELNNLTFPITCPILGIPLRYNSERMGDDSYSIDRIDSERGYEIDNIVVISWRANRLKNDGSIEEISKISRFYEDLEKKKGGI